MMKCPKCGNEMKLVAEKMHPVRLPPEYTSEGKGSLTYRDIYYCTTCDKTAVVRVNLRMEATKEDVRMWKV